MEKNPKQICREKMPDKDWVKIRRNYHELLDQIDPDLLIDRLYSEFILDDDDCEEICTLRSKSRREAARKLLNTLRRRGPTAYGGFLTALTANGYPTVFQKLQNCNEDFILHPGTPFAIKIDVNMYVMDSELRSIPLEPNPELAHKIQVCVQEAIPDLIPAIACAQANLNETRPKLALPEILANVTEDNPTNVTKHSLSVQSVIELIDLLEAFAGNRETIIVTELVEKRSSLDKYKVISSISGIVGMVNVIGTLAFMSTSALIVITPISGLVVLMAGTIQGFSVIRSTVEDIHRTQATKVELSKLLKTGDELHKQIIDKLAISNLAIQSSTIPTTLKETCKVIISNIDSVLVDTAITESSLIQLSLIQLSYKREDRAMDQLLNLTNSMNRDLAQLTQMVKDLKSVSEELKLQTSNYVSQ
ncbi:uncharacterized protein LOC126824605 [Patella vulgata]|uniref:uncharacterized protein LOC126824605 n=1 Tax=Patella vulgata TaxID=6465 RepID=UPI00217F9B80|nr:uncharacterized protein LOC126824605 [Patella vulgata]XP_050409834.1 uncharacterized protein LOC126824605 [Patella vulgata]XP_050409842.1 uncharacterized protein LOC126824605 [Patella vulgata]XP_050409848.1 uncharacterized protein LOC126824605 [Patella vulgata]